MSLYSGITFGSSVAKSGSGSKDDAISVDAASGNNARDAAGKTAAQADADKYAAEQAANAAREQQESNRKAALGFQPVVRKRPAAGSAALKPRMATTTTMAAVAAGPSVSSTANASSSASPLAAAAPATQSAEPAPASTSAPATTTGGTSMVGRTLIVAPSMTLADEDVNGFASSAAGKKAHAQANKRTGGNKKSKAKRRGGAGAEEDPSLAWTAEYDPARPTDYTMYKEYTKLLRAQKREAAREDRRLKEREQRLREAYGESGTGSGSSGSDEDDGDNSDEERRRRIDAAEKRFKGFVPPPVSYDAPVQSYPYGNDDDAVPDDTDEEDAPQGMQGVQAAPVAPVPLASNEADEWASWSGAAPPSGAAGVDDPYARRMAMSMQHQAGQPSQQPQPAQPQPYTPAPQPPAFPHPSAFGAPPMNLPLPGGQSIPLPPSFQTRPASASPLPGHSPAGTSQAPQPPPTTAAPVGVSIEEAQARARAIAARLAAMKSGASPAGPSGASSPYVAPPASSYDGIPGIDPPQPPAPQASIGGRPSPSAGIASQGNPEDFAKNLMNKYGWTKGQGLGATSQGMLNPLALSTDPASVTAGASKKKKQQQQAQQQQQQAQAKVTGMASAKGRVTSDLKTEKERAERDKFGEPTRIVCLSNMVGRDEVDEELVNDVSEEAGKLGILERCFVHVMPEYAPEEDAVRVFIVYSGLVGAWKAAKAFEGRHFGGRQVRARFYDETAFATRTLHL